MLTPTRNKSNDEEYKSLVKSLIPLYGVHLHRIFQGLACYDPKNEQWHIGRCSYGEFMTKIEDFIEQLLIGEEEPNEQKSKDNYC